MGEDSAEQKTERSEIIAAVQRALTSFGDDVAAEMDAVRADLASERQARHAADQRLVTLAEALEQSHRQNQAFQAELLKVLEQRLVSFGASSKARLDAADLHIATVRDEAIESSDEVAALSTRVDAAEATHRDVHELLLTAIEEQRDAHATVAAAGVAAAATVAELSTRLDGLDVRLDATSLAIDHEVSDRATVAAELRSATVELGDRLDTTTSDLRTSLDSVTVELAADVDAKVAAASEELRLAVEGVAAEVEAKAAAVSQHVRLANEGLAAEVEVKLAAASEELRLAVESLAADMDAKDAAVSEELRLATAGLAAEVEVKLAAASDELLATTGERIADITQHVVATTDERLAAATDAIDGTVTARITALRSEFEQFSDGLDSSLGVLNARSNAIDARVDELKAALAEIDLDALDDLEERVSTAAGEAVLLRIETERFQETVKEMDASTQLRIAEVETQVQSQNMDVEQAIQLDRLEEIERALIELDPAQFVRVDQVGEDSEQVAEVSISADSGETEDDASLPDLGRADQDSSSKPTLPRRSA